MGKDKIRMGMINFKNPSSDVGENEDTESTKITIPDEVYEEISILYFNEVYERNTKVTKELIERIKSLENKIETLIKEIKGEKV